MVKRVSDVVSCPRKFTNGCEDSKCPSFFKEKGNGFCKEPRKGGREPVVEYRNPPPSEELVYQQVIKQNVQSMD